MPDSEESKTFAFRVTGRVQDVCFRYFTCQQARALGVSGEVRNEGDGSVCGKAAGSPENLEKFFDHLRVGPNMARVDELSLYETREVLSVGFHIA